MLYLDAGAELGGREVPVVAVVVAFKQEVSAIGEINEGDETVTLVESAYRWTER